MSSNELYELLLNERYPERLTIKNGINMEVRQMRIHLLDAYPDSGTWPAKVNKMADNQVIATFRRLQAAGKIKV